MVFVQKKEFESAKLYSKPPEVYHEMNLCFGLLRQGSNHQRMIAC